MAQQIPEQFYYDPRLDHDAHVETMREQARREAFQAEKRAWCDTHVQDASGRWCPRMHDDP